MRNAIINTNGFIGVRPYLFISPTCANFLVLEHDWITQLDHWQRGPTIVYMYEDLNANGMAISLPLMGTRGVPLRLIVVDIYTEVGLMKADEYARQLAQVQQRLLVQPANAFFLNQQANLLLSLQQNQAQRLANVTPAQCECCL
jgi:hypothetical protein